MHLSTAGDESICRAASEHGVMTACARADDENLKQSSRIIITADNRRREYMHGKS
jgi:hypothetical protein